MKVWQLNSPNNLQRADAPDLELTEDKVKVKITKALLSEADVAVYSGATRVKYPVVPGRFAIGQVTEAAEDSYMKKGDRVYLAGVTEDECAPDGLRFAGQTAFTAILSPRAPTRRTCFPLPSRTRLPFSSTPWRWRSAW